MFILRRCLISAPALGYESYERCLDKSNYMIDTAVYPIDVWGIKRIGVENYVADHRLPRFFAEDMEDFHALTERYLGWIDHYHDNPVARDVLIALAPTQTMVLSAVHATRQEQVLAEKGVKTLLGRTDRPVQGYAREFLRQQCDSFSKSFQRVTRLRSRLKCTLKNAWSKWQGHFIPHPYYNLFDVGQIELRKWADQNEVTPLPVYPYYDKLNDTSTPWVEAVVSDVLEALPVLKTMNAILPREEIVRSWEKTISLGVAFYRNQRRHLGSCNGRVLLVTKMGNMDFRLFTMAWRRQGGETIGFTHGNMDFHAYGYFHRDLLDHMLVDRYVCLSELEMASYKRAIEDLVPPTRCPQACLEYLGEQSPVPSCIPCEPASNGSPVALIIGYPHKHGEWGLILHSPDVMRLEHLAIRELQSMGYRVVYKIHPDRREETFDLYKGIADEVWDMPFLEARKKADLLVYCVRQTTAFVEGFETDIPMIVFKEEHDLIPSATRDVLLRRVAFIPINSTNDQGSCFSRHDLEAAMLEAMRLCRGSRSGLVMSGQERCKQV